VGAEFSTDYYTCSRIFSWSGGILSVVVCFTVTAPATSSIRSVRSGDSGKLTLFDNLDCTTRLMLLVSSR
jgi:hypothetical protein